MKQTSECNKKEADADIENKLAVTMGRGKWREALQGQRDQPLCIK